MSVDEPSLAFPLPHCPGLDFLRLSFFLAEDRAEALACLLPEATTPGFDGFPRPRQFSPACV